MPPFNPIQTNFTAGELSPRLLGRVDYERYANGTKKLQNFIIQQQGGAYRRSGTRFVHEVKDSTKKTRLIPFEFSTTQAYVLEFGDQYIRFYKDEGIIVNPGPVELSTTYLEADLFDLQYTQSADTLYIVGQKYKPRKLTRTSHVNWSITDIPFLDGPYMAEKDNLTITPSGTSGSVTLTASASLFASTDVGRLVRLKHSSVWSWFEITAYTSATVVTATVRSASTTASASSAYRMGAFYEGNYPRCVIFHDQRLCFSNTPAEPQTLWMSESGDYESFQPTDGSTTTVLDSSAITATIVSNKVNATLWMLSGTVLSLGTIGAEWQVKAGAINESIKPTNINVTEQTTWGSRPVRPTKVGAAALFVQRSGRKIREYQYEYSVDSFKAMDLSVLGEHLLREGNFIADMAYQQEPDSVVWMARDDGLLLGMTYVAEQKVVGFHQHPIGGSYSGGSWGIVESIVSIPTSDGTSDQLWLIVKRTINGSTKRYVEFLEEAFVPTSPTDKTGMFFVDSGLTYSGAPTTTITGLGHLEGQTVGVCADGSVHPDRTVSGGSITLQKSASLVQVGLKYSSLIKTLPVEGGAPYGTAQGKQKRVHRVSMRLLNALTLRYGPNETKLAELSFRKTNDPMDSSPPFFTGDREINIDGEYESQSGYCIEQSNPYPLNILALMPKFQVTEG